MQASSHYSFSQSEVSQTAYVLENIKGREIPHLLGVYTRHKVYGGRQFVYFDSRITHNGNRHYAKSLFSTNPILCAEHQKRFGFSGVGDKKPKANITGLKFLAEYPQKAFGDYANASGKNWAILAGFGNGNKSLGLYFFEGQKHAAETLFEKWIAGELVLAPDIKPMQS
ncbi:hypothetical protein NO2_0617 [Candidatus Termititenax persephonae]|uniref:Uncharacterized protein n=1 Tax=Candidatus Termititenax persephonae TaxID=2218525 RepID=A0A388TGK4_9BACT|nr:hypothetical protein NO2_0617 [Candidatus Termititenax persephonae]